MTDSHNHEENSCEDGCNNKSIGTIFNNDTIDNNNKCSGWTTNLYTASTEKGDKKSSNNCGIESLLRTNTRGNCKSN